MHSIHKYANNQQKPSLYSSVNYKELLWLIRYFTKKVSNLFSGSIWLQTESRWPSEIDTSDRSSAEKRICFRNTDGKTVDISKTLTTVSTQSRFWGEGQVMVQKLTELCDHVSEGNGIDLVVRVESRTDQSWVG